MEKFLQNLLNKKLLVVIASAFVAFGAGTLLASACGYSSCGCSYTERQAVKKFLNLVPQRGSQSFGTFCFAPNKYTYLFVCFGIVHEVLKC